jgi:hypothetical protein
MSFGLYFVWSPKKFNMHLRQNVPFVLATFLAEAQFKSYFALFLFLREWFAIDSSTPNLIGNLNEHSIYV